MTSIAQLQRESDVRRVELAETLNQLRDGVAPSALSAEAIALAKDSGLSLIKTLAEQARANPVPALLIGAGLTMLLTRTTGRDVMGVAGSTLKSAATASAEAARGAASGMASAASSAASAASDAASSAAGAVRGAAASAADAVRGAAAGATGAADEMRFRVGEHYESMMDKVQDGVDASRRELHDRQDQAAGMMGSARDQARKMADQTQQTFSQLMEEQPILMAALGAALGAAIGAALPLSKAEKDMIGAAGARAVGAARESLSSAADVLREEAQSADLGAKVGELADKVVQNVTKDVRHPV